MIDTNILIYHTKGSQITIDFLSNLITQDSFNISILTKIEFLGWDKHTTEGFKKCKELLEPANIYPVGEEIANKAIELRRERNIKLADAVIAATALLNNLKLATRNVDDFKAIEGLELINPLD
ncbi:MAG: type II toxin-antitoxin system VapC family toxin [Deltaproteobacteria bacterium]|nr:type II toxin-antitoxin system VapC family toxin [Deltaproteobacteria bacterium]MBW1796327.1 type II toxin-antitoxin system VapC family toxin [Deltaproteobacteria bacterium]